ncbi:hypothetical protein K402DRAFT_391222 [Aulographum hederae CBS 113979]|uniref:Uncharacterized protein n=1 Tax=Aulographum hederae CBS 113979 TaxID=1176131 RepID=A0A6G1H7T7_9PEZI|nr:hypothetical protein K402DRAFT_391222 [Aulographum hederae CBS 113979]
MCEPLQRPAPNTGPIPEPPSLEVVVIDAVLYWREAVDTSGLLIQLGSHGPPKLREFAVGHWDPDLPLVRCYLLHRQQDISRKVDPVTRIASRTRRELVTNAGRIRAKIRPHRQHVRAVLPAGWPRRPSEDVALLVGELVQDVAGPLDARAGVLKVFAPLFGGQLCCDDAEDPMAPITGSIL